MNLPLSPRGRRRRLLLGSLPVWMAGCASIDPSPDGAPTPPADDPELPRSDWASACDVAPAPASARWTHKRFGAQAPTRYTAGVHEGRPAVHAFSRAGNSALRLMMPPVALVEHLRLTFSWWLPRLNEAADLRDSDIDDSVARIILSFQGDRSRFTARDHLLSELAHVMTGEPLPDATLMYVWDNGYPTGTVIDNPHTRRIRQLVVQSGPADLGRWVDHDRDLRADFALAFDEPMPALAGVALMSDSNNTGATVEAWFGPVGLKPARPR